MSMTQTPRTIQSVTTIGLTLLFILYVAAGVMVVLTKATPIFEADVDIVFVVFLIAAAGVALLKIDMWGHFIFIACAVSALAFNLYSIYQMGPDVWHILSAFIILMGLASIAKKKIAIFFFYPDKRLWERLDCRGLDVKAEIETETHPISVDVLNLALSGAMIAAPLELKKGQVLKMKLKFDSKTFKLRSKVVNDLGVGYGLEYHKPFVYMHLPYIWALDQLALRAEKKM